MGTSEKRNRNKINITQEEILCQICGRRGYTAPTYKKLNQTSQQKFSGAIIMS